MTTQYDKEITAIQADIYRKTGRRTDAYYREGQGVLLVPEGYPLVERNVIQAVPEQILAFMRI
jgi:hypothetical protein